jgi:CBS domain-containing protein
MAEYWIGALPVVERGPGGRLVGVITEFDLLKARHRQLIEERQRERVLRLRRPEARIELRPSVAFDSASGEEEESASSLNQP